MQLLSKSERDGIGIDTVERGLVFSLLALQIGVYNTTNDGKIIFGFSLGSESRIIGTVKIKIDKVDSLSELGNYLHNVIPYNDSTLSINWQTTPATTVEGDDIPDDPFTFTCLEQYFVWLAYILSASISPNTSYCKISVSDEDAGSFLKISLSLPFNYPKYLLTSNYLLATNRIVSSYIVDTSQTSGNNIMIPSSQFWLDPLNSLSALQAYPYQRLNEGTTLAVKGQGLFTFYKYRGDLDPDGTTIIKPTGGTSERWIKYAASGNISFDWNDITGKPTAFPPSDHTHSEYATIESLNGKENSLGNPASNGYVLSSLTNGTRSWIAFPDLDWGNITNKPSFFSGSYIDLTNKPNFASVATSGSYTDLTNKPTIPTNTNQLTNGANFITAAQAPVTSVNGQTGDITISATASDPNLLWDDKCSSNDYPTTNTEYNSYLVYNSKGYREVTDTNNVGYCRYFSPEDITVSSKFTLNFACYLKAGSYTGYQRLAWGIYIPGTPKTIYLLGFIQWDNQGNAWFMQRSDNAACTNFYQDYYNSSGGSQPFTGNVLFYKMFNGDTEYLVARTTTTNYNETASKTMTHSASNAPSGFNNTNYYFWCGWEAQSASNAQRQLHYISLRKGLIY